MGMWVNFFDVMTQTIKSEIQNNGGIAALSPSFFSVDILRGTDLSESESYCWSMEAVKNSGERIKSYRDLMVWQMSIDLVRDIYKLTQVLPIEERYGLANQMRRSSVSIPCNIAEGKTRRSAAGLLYFLKITQGSIAELQTQIEIAQRLQYIEQSQIKSIWQKTDTISKMLYVLSRKIETHQKATKKD